MMKILIGTPIHQKNDDTIEKWLKNVSRLQYPADFLMVDGSPGTDYTKKVEAYCQKYGVKNYAMKHLEINQEQGMDEIIGRSREIIRQEILSKDYDAWFSWEHNQIIPPDTLEGLVRMMKFDDYTMIHHNFGVEKIPLQPIASLGCTLIKRECLKKYGFLLKYPNMPNTWHGGENWFKKQVLEGGGNYIEVYGTIRTWPPRKRMKVLIGTPIHQVKDYAMERWLESVSKLEYPADFLMVDNSPGADYIEKVRSYCSKYSIKNYKIGHLRVDPEFRGDTRVEMSQEIIRQEVLSKNYDAWFSWECDQIIPPDALDKLVRLMKAGDFMMVNHNGWVRGHSGQTRTDFGVSLIKRECLEKYSLLLQFETGSDISDGWEPGEVWIKKQILKDNALEVEGVIKPIYHLDK